MDYMSELDKYPKPAMAVDIVIFTIIDDILKVLLIKRGRNPYAGKWCLPGGFVLIAESLEDAALRELREETNVKDVYLGQLYTFGNPKRDSRGRVISVAYYALANHEKISPKITGDESIKNVEWHNVNKLPELGFDHKEILEYALKRLRYKLEYSVVGLELLPEKFTLTQLQKMYEIILNEPIDKRNFRKKISTMNFLEDTEEMKKGSHRPAKLYTFRKMPASKFKKIKLEK